MVASITTVALEGIDARSIDKRKLLMAILFIVTNVIVLTINK